MGSIFFFLLMVLVAYLCGSLCSAVLISRIFSLPDPCAEGSKNPGATNVLRLAGKKYALMVLAADMLKGLLPVLLAHALGASITVLGFTCFAAVLGHMYPIFFNFKGGKGVATALGALLGLHFIMGVCVIATWLLVANFFRYSSLASLVSLAFAPFYAIYFLQTSRVFPPLLFMTMMVFYQHRENIKRLTDGVEPKINFKRHQLTDLTTELTVDAPPPCSEETKVAEKKAKAPAKKKMTKPSSTEEKSKPPAPKKNRKPKA